jgi:hypothetical protein
LWCLSCFSFIIGSDWFKVVLGLGSLQEQITKAKAKANATSNNFLIIYISKPAVIFPLLIILFIVQKIHMPFVFLIPGWRKVRSFVVENFVVRDMCRIWHEYFINDTICLNQPGMNLWTQ